MAYQTIKNAKKATVARKAQATIELNNATFRGVVERIEGQNAYVLVGNDVMKFHIDELKFDNDINREYFEKQVKRANGKAYKVSQTRVAMSLSAGNKKLKDSDVVGFLQWNMMSGRINEGGTCPFLTENCLKNCYALKAERMYPSVKARRTSNTEFSKSERFVNTMIEQIEHELGRKKYQGKTILVRIHEAGEFYSQEYMNKWVEIANHFKGNRQIVFMAYTKSLPFVKGAFKKYGEDNVNITFKSSIWDDTKPKFIKMTEDLGLSVFTAMPKGEIEKKNYLACPSSEAFKNTPKEKDCGACGACYFAEVDTAIEIH
jgi:Gene product 88